MKNNIFSLLSAGSVCVLTGCTNLSGDMCTLFCTDSTRIQRRYVDARDECRELSELKLQTMQQNNAADVSPAAADKAAKTRLVGAFSDCMGSHAWAVPAPTPPEDKKKDVPAPQVAGAGEPPAPVSAKVAEDARKRAADCAFARSAADMSMVAKKRAEACDIECLQQQKLAPEAPKPAAYR